MSDQKPPIEGKVWSSTLGSGVGLALTSLVLWILGVTVWRMPIDAGSEIEAIASVPKAVAAPVGIFFTVGLTLLSGYLAKHTPRPEVTEALDNLDEVEDDLDEDDPDLGTENDIAPDIDIQDEEAIPAEPQPAP